MRKITNNELSDSLNNKIDNLQDATSLELMTESKTIVGAINELYGKDVIANAIGEPLNSTDTFSEMGSEINGLLSTFKTNMMNAGVAVESGDKFKALIDKIKGLTEGEGNKGVQFAEGTYTRTEDFLPLTTNVVYNLNFTPTFVLLNIGNMVECCANYNMYNVWISNLNQTVIPSKSGDGYSYKLQLTDITNSSFNITNNSTYGIGYINNIKWYAIRVGEEDTTSVCPTMIADTTFSNANRFLFADEDETSTCTGTTGAKLVSFSYTFFFSGECAMRVPLSKFSSDYSSTDVHIEITSKTGEQLFYETRVVSNYNSKENYDFILTNIQPGAVLEMYLLHDGTYNGNSKWQGYERNDISMYGILQ